MFSGRRKSESRKITPRTTSLAMLNPLGPTFAEEVLELETQLDFDGSVELVQRLMELYTKAIEYYESIQDLKYLAYTERMQNLLIRKDVLNLIKQPSKTTVSNPPTPTNKLASDETIRKKKEEVAVKQRIRAQKFNFALGSSVPETRNAEKIITTHMNDAQNTSKKIQENLRSQGDALHMRLMQRKAARSRGNSVDAVQSKPKLFIKTMTDTSPFIVPVTPTHFMNQESDRSGGPARKKSMEHFEEGLEKIMEKFVEEKMLTTRSIKNRYKHDIEQVKQMGQGELVNQILIEIDKSMNEEISQAIKLLENKRKEEISVLRQRLCC